jgi:hypothetical protein
MHLELFLVRVLIPCTPVVGILRFFFFFSPGVPLMFSREGYHGYVNPCRVIVVVTIISFLSSSRGLEFPLFDGDTGALLQLQ